MKKLLSVVFAIVIMLTMTVSVYAKVAAVPSIERHEGTQVVTDEDSNAGVITKTDGEKIPVPAEALIVTNVSKAYNMEGDAEVELMREISDSLIGSMEEFMEVETLAELCPDLESFIAEVNPGFTIDDYVLSDLFDATLISGYDEILHDDYATNIEITFDMGLTDNTEEPIFMYRDQEGEWHVIPEENVTVNEDNSVTVFFLEICPIAILMMASGMIIENPDIVSPQTGVNWTPYIICGIAVVLALSAFVVLKSKKRA